MDALTGPVTGPLPAFRGHHASRRRGQSVTVSLAALRTVAIVASVVAVSVVLSVVATITLISVMNAGVILPQYTRYNQPTQVGQLGLCLGSHGRIWTPQHLGFCHHGKFVHIQPRITHP